MIIGPGQTTANKGDVTYTADYKGAWANNIQVAHTFTAGTGMNVAVTYASSTGYPLITVTVASGTGATASGVVNLVNADETASQYVTASYNASGAGNGVIGALTATALSGGVDAVGAAADAEPPYSVVGEPIWLRVTNKTTLVVDIEDTVNARILHRNKWRYDVLGQP